MSEKFFSQKSGSVTVFMYESELDFLKWLVLQKPHIETGGDLFGLWQDEGTAVVQIILGPGKDCRRTTTSFHQDVIYLREAGAYFTSSLGLCNIGEWHSHHTLGLAQPSVGDQQTVWNHIPSVSGGRFLVFIANIRGNPAEVNVGCFLFNSNEQKMVQGNIKCLPGSSPIRLTLENMNLTSEAEPSQTWAKYQVSKQRKDKSKESSFTGRGANHISKTSSMRNGNQKSRNSNSSTKEKPSTTASILSNSPKDSKRSVANVDARSGNTNARNDNTKGNGNEMSNAPSAQSSKTRNANTRVEQVAVTKVERRSNKISNTTSKQNDNVNPEDRKTKQKGAKPSNATIKNSNNSNKNSKTPNASSFTSKKKPRRKAAKIYNQKQKISSGIFTNVKNFLATHKWLMLIYIALLTIILYNTYIAN